jgi:hypothetical protein
MAPSPCSGFRNAHGPYATVGASFTALPSAVQFEAEREVISLGEVPRAIVRAGNTGIGRFNETSKFRVTDPDGSRNEGPCDPAREPGSSAGFAALNFKCHPFTQIGVYTIQFDPAHSSLSGEPVEFHLRVVKDAPKTPPAPAGWQSLALTSGLPQSDCYSYGESYVAALVHEGLVKGEGVGSAKIPAPLANRMSEDHARGVKYVFESDDGWVVMFDHGEFGGGIEWYARTGGQPRSIFGGPPAQDDFVPQNVNRALAADGVIYVLQGLSHMGISEGQLVRIWREHDHFSSHVIARYASEPVDWIRRDDGAWFVATWNAIWETREGAPSTVVARLPEIMSYPTSLLLAADGTFFVGTRGGVVRLTPTWPDAPRYAADFLWEAGSQTRDCRLNDEAQE